MTPDRSSTVSTRSSEAHCANSPEVTPKPSPTTRTRFGFGWRRRGIWAWALWTATVFVLGPMGKASGVSSP